jgi:hypothetical protein
MTAQTERSHPLARSWSLKALAGTDLGSSSRVPQDRHWTASSITNGSGMLCRRRRLGFLSFCGLKLLPELLHDLGGAQAMSRKQVEAVVEGIKGDAQRIDEGAVEVKEEAFHELVLSRLRG